MDTWMLLIIIAFLGIVLAVDFLSKMSEELALDDPHLVPTAGRGEVLLVSMPPVGILARNQALRPRLRDQSTSSSDFRQHPIHRFLPPQNLPPRPDMPSTGDNPTCPYMPSAGDTPSPSSFRGSNFMRSDNSLYDSPVFRARGDGNFFRSNNIVPSSENTCNSKNQQHRFLFANRIHAPGSSVFQSRLQSNDVNQGDRVRAAGDNVRPQNNQPFNSLANNNPSRLGEEIIRQGIRQRNDNEGSQNFIRLEFGFKNDPPRQ